MKTVWKYSLETEALRVMNTANQMAIGFFRLNNFLVLPYPQKIVTPQIVLLPDLEFNEIRRFWDKARLKDAFNMPPQVDPVTIKKLEGMLIGKRIVQPEYENTKKDWEKGNSEIMSKIYEILPSKKDILKKLVIFPTVFGTSCSFSDVSDDGTLYVYLRHDQGIWAIVEAILTELTRPEVYKDLSGSWSESELLSDYLLTKTSIYPVVKKYAGAGEFEPTVKSIRFKQNAKLVKESDNFYRKLGLPDNTNIFSLKGGSPEVFDKPLKNLTETERVILKLLINKANNVTTFDEIGGALFKSDEDFSLYAITKSVQRVRNKLEENGLSGAYIQTLRGQGYLLKN